MHLLLTDRLCCPRCGPSFGLILLADRMQDRRVSEGVLGCPNCRDAFPIEAGAADLRPPPRRDPGTGLAGAEWSGDGDAAERWAALLALTGGPGTVLLVGAPAADAAALAPLAEEVDWVAADPAARSWTERERVSRITVGDVLPFFSRVLRGVVVDGRIGSGLLEEACRVVAPRCRVVVANAGAGAESTLSAAGLEVLASENRTVVAARG